VERHRAADDRHDVARREAPLLVVASAPTEAGPVATESATEEIS